MRYSWFFMWNFRIEEAGEDKKTCIYFSGSFFINIK